MKSVIPIALLAAGATADSAAEGVTPIGKVLQMLGDLMAKGKSEKHDEEVRYTAFKEWCAGTKSEKEDDIEIATNKATQLNADIEKAAADAEALGQDISNLNADIGTWESENAAEAAQRKAEKDAFMAAHADLSDSVDAIERAITVLKSREADVPQALIEVRRVVAAASNLAAKPTAGLVTMKSLTGDASRVANLLSEASSIGLAAQPNAYEFQSGSVVEMLEKLRLRFQDERTALETEEHNRKSTAEMVMEKLHNEIVYAKDQVSQKTERKAGVEQEGAEARADLGETLKAKDADQAFLRETMAECATKASDFKQRQKLRADEIVAIQKAVEIISSPEVSGAGDAHLPASMVQVRKGAALAQLRSTGGREPASTPQERARALLMQRAEQAGSQMLMTVAARIGEDPFVKVRKMIKDLLVRLMEEANAEADHKGWCDEELAVNKKTRDEKTADANRLTSLIEEKTAVEAKLTKEIADLGDQLSALMAEVKEATETRQAEKAKNTATIADAVQAQSAVKQAIKVLRDFYAKAETATSLTQRGAAPGEAATEKPATFDTPYQGMQGSSGGVLGMLEVVESDFARLELDTTTAENEAARQYDDFYEASEVDRKTKEREARHKGFDLTRAKHAIHEAKKDLEATQEELDAALAYFEKLRPSCVDSGLSYEQRVQMREEEIKSLQEALEILQAEDLGF